MATRGSTECRRSPSGHRMATPMHSSAARVTPYCTGKSPQRAPKVGVDRTPRPGERSSSATWWMTLHSTDSGQPC